MTESELKSNIDSVRARLARCASNVKIVAATKTVPVELINAAIAHGITDIGENRVQEYVAKRDGVQGGSWHFIGTLQPNKAKYLVGNVDLIQSVNSIKLADEINRLAIKRGTVQRVLMEVNVCGESGKTGAAADTAFALAEHVDGLDNVALCGLMSVPPVAADDKAYRDTARLFEALARGRTGFTVLSVGMSGDYERAVAFGSNMIRLGTALFGARSR